MVFNNGQTQEINRRQPDRLFAIEPRRVGIVQESSRLDGLNSVGSYQASCSGKDSFREISNEQADPNGKILERLEFIESAYTTYVSNHQRDLEAKLAESKQQQEIFKKTIEELKQEIHKLISSQEETEDNS